jgi:hypothetical protein
VDVSADGDWAGDGLDIGLFQEDFLGFFAEDAKVLLVQALGLQQVGNALVDVHQNSNILKFILQNNYKSNCIRIRPHRLAPSPPHPDPTLNRGTPLTYRREC